MSKSGMAGIYGKIPCLLGCGGVAVFTLFPAGNHPALTLSTGCVDRITYG